MEGPVEWRSEGDRLDAARGAAGAAVGELRAAIMALLIGAGVERIPVRPEALRVTEFVNGLSASEVMCWAEVFGEVVRKERESTL